MCVLENPDVDTWTPAKPVCWYKKTDDTPQAQSFIVERVNGDTVLPPDKEDWECTLETKEHGETRRTYRKRLTVWSENKGKVYHIVTTHCPSEVKTELQNQPGWAGIKNGINVIGLLLLIRDLLQKKMPDKQGTMSLVENNMTMYTTSQTKTQTLGDYYQEFKVNYNTITAHGGKPGYYPKIYATCLAKKRAEEGMEDEGVWEAAAGDIPGSLDIGKAMHKKIAGVEKAALETLHKEYLAALFLLMGHHGRFQALKLGLRNYFLKDNNEYKKTVVGMKRLMADWDMGGIQAPTQTTRPQAKTPEMVFTVLDTLHPCIHVSTRMRVPIQIWCPLTGTQLTRRHI